MLHTYGAACGTKEMINPVLSTYMPSLWLRTLTEPPAPASVRDRLFASASGSVLSSSVETSVETWCTVLGTGRQ